MEETNNVEHTSIEISNLSKLLASSIKSKLCQKSPSFSESCIFKVPRELRQRNANVFDPIIVSIGPFHNANKRLAPMKEIKLWYLHCFLNQFPLPPEETLVHFVERIRVSLKCARDYYAEPINPNDDKFIEMMVVDGCFLIELFRKHAGLVPKDKDDPIFNTSWMLENLCRDLILLENQIPWFVLQRLFELTMAPIRKKETDLLLQVLVLSFFDKKMLMTVPVEYSPSGCEIKHILDLLHSCLLSSSDSNKPNITRWKQLPSVTDLLQAGIKFEKGSTRDGIFNIKFDNGVFVIPPISIQSNSESLFQNLIAYEQCYRDCTQKKKRVVTSYAVFLDCLINTTKDVDKLSSEGILEHASSTEDISFLFNRLYNGTHVYESYYGEVSWKVYNYYKSLWPRWKTTFKRQYLKNPWVFSSFMAAILIMVFTFTQTLFTILSYHGFPFSK